MKSFVKDPAATLDYTIDWSQWLDNDTIATSGWVVESGITIVPGSETNTTTTTTLFLRDGTAGDSYTITNSISTAGGRIDERSFKIQVRNR